MRKSVILLVISILIISFTNAESNETETNNETVGLVNNESNETEINNSNSAVNETETNETTNETEIEYTDEELADIIPNAGITPDSALYCVDVFVDNVRATLTPSSLGKAKVRLNIMEERMAEMEEMASKNKTTEAKRAELEGQKQMEKFESSVEKIKKKDVKELSKQIQMHVVALEVFNTRAWNYGQPDYTDAIAEAIRRLEALEEVIVDIPEDLDPDSIFIINAICKEAGATTAEECNEMISSGALTARVRILPANHTDPHNCSGFWASRGTKWCCEDSDRTYSPEWVEMRKSEGMDNILNYYYRKGTVEYKIINLKTEEVEHGIETDSCDGNILTEWLCPTSMNMITRNERYSEEYECPYGCQDGACINCNSDSICDENEDCSCSDCEGERNGCRDQYSFCQNGECVYMGVKESEEEFEGECMDSDEGIYYFIKGTTIGKSSTSNLAQPYIDTCMGDSYLGEGYCGANEEVHIMRYLCPNGCEEGVCL